MAKRVTISETPAVYFVNIYSSDPSSRSLRGMDEGITSGADTRWSGTQRSIDSVSPETNSNTAEYTRDEDGEFVEVFVETIRNTSDTGYGAVDSVVDSTEVTQEWVETILPRGDADSMIEVVASENNFDSAKETTLESCQALLSETDRTSGAALTSQADEGSSETSPPSLNRGLTGPETSEYDADLLTNSACTSRLLVFESSEATTGTPADWMSNEAMSLKTYRSSGDYLSSDGSNYNESTPRLKGGVTPRSSGSTKGSRSGSRKGSRKSSLKGSRRGSENIKKESEAGVEKLAEVTEVSEVATEADDIEEKPMIKFDPEKPFSDDCERFQQDCPCCHCEAVRRAIKRATFYVTPEGQERLRMKRDVKNFFMDINAMSRVRWGIQAKLYGTKDPYPSPLEGFPIGITSVKPVDRNSLSISWYIHDYDNIDHYEILVDGNIKKRVFSPQQTSTMLLDVVTCCPHKIIMRTVPKVMSDGDILIDLLCRFGMNQVLNICKSQNNTRMSSRPSTMASTKTSTTTPTKTKTKGCPCDKNKSGAEQKPVDKQEPVEDQETVEEQEPVEEPEPVEDQEPVEERLSTRTSTTSPTKAKTKGCPCDKKKAVEGKKAVEEQKKAVGEQKAVEEQKPAKIEIPDANKRPNLLEFWKPSEHIYMPCNACNGECICEWID